MKELKASELEFLRGELELWRDSKIISPQQAYAIESLYKLRTSPLYKIFMLAGLALVALGVISFIAANWDEFDVNIKFIFIILGYLAPLIVSYVLEDFYDMHRTAGVFLLFASLALGGGVVLLLNMFGASAFGKFIYNFESGRVYAVHTGIWLLGVIPAIIIFKDSLELILAQCLAGLYLLQIRAADIFIWHWRSAGFNFNLLVQPVRAWILILALWLLWLYISNFNKNFLHRVNFNLNLLLTLLFAGSRLNYCLGTSLTTLILAAFGFVMSLIIIVNQLDNLYDLGAMSLFIAGVFGLALTFADFWQGSPLLAVSSADALSVITAIILVPLFLWHLYKGRSMGGVFFVLLIMRYFFDNILSYVSRGWGFTLVGLACALIGFYAERRFRNRNKNNREARDHEIKEFN